MIFETVLQCSCLVM